MYDFVVEHKYCKMVKVVCGANVFDAFAKNGLDFAVWEVIEMYEKN